MKVAGEVVLHAPIEQVWAALNDPAVLVRTIPGCERLETTGTDAYAMTVSAGVASIKGTYAGRVSLSDQRQPNSFTLNASGAGGPGTVSADVKVMLAESDGATRLSYDADAVVGGVIGGVGQRMLAGVAKKMAGEFFAQVDQVLTGQVDAGPLPAGRSAAGPGFSGRGPSATGSTAGSGVFTAVRTGSRRPSFGGAGFGVGTAVGAAIALLGVLVGSRLRPRSDHRWWH
jgi:carbon monoxide dehydrogenase subunit G